MTRLSILMLISRHSLIEGSHNSWLPFVSNEKFYLWLVPVLMDFVCSLDYNIFYIFINFAQYSFNFLFLPCLGFLH